MRYATMTSLFLLTSANIQDIQRELEKIIARELNQTMKDFSPRSIARFGVGNGVDVSALQEYGCWCYFDELHGQGKGMPQDPFDQQCQILHHAFKCAKAEIAGCNSQEGEGYRTSGVIQHSIEESCNISDNTECQKAACMMSQYFSWSMWILFSHVQVVPDYVTYSHAQGVDTSVCEKQEPLDDRNFECCGSYGDNTKRPFHPITSECCSGEVRKAGGC